MNYGQILTLVTFLMISLIIFLFILSGLAMIPINNVRLLIIRNQFERLNSQDIAQSRILGQDSKIGHEGASNYCDFSVWEFRASLLSREEIEKAYQNFTLKSFWGDKNTPLEVDLLFTDDEWFTSSYYWRGLWEQDEIQEKIRPGELSYVVFTSSDSHSHFGDIRCY